MKVSISTLALTITIIQGSMLHINKQTSSTNMVLDTEIFLQGTQGEPTQEDMDFIGKALFASYKNVHWEVGHYMTLCATKHRLLYTTRPTHCCSLHKQSLCRI
jgi:hypothetical protein